MQYLKSGKNGSACIIWCSPFLWFRPLTEHNRMLFLLNYQNEDDFYSFIENKVYSEKDLFKKFNIRKVIK
jgi:hypothetical protein